MTEITTAGGVTLAKLTGDLDHHTAGLIRTEIDREIKLVRPELLIIDFIGVTFMDSSGIGLIMGRYKLMQDHGGRVVVTRPPSYIKKVLKLAGIDRLTPIKDELDGLLPENKETEKGAKSTDATDRIPQNN